MEQSLNGCLKNILERNSGEIFGSKPVEIIGRTTGRTPARRAGKTLQENLWRTPGET